MMEYFRKIPEAEFTAAKVEQVVMELYRNSENGPDPETNIFLLQAQVSHAALNFSRELLHPTKPVEVQFFAAKCLHIKVSGDWLELDEFEQGDLKTLLKSRSLQDDGSAKFFTSKLHQVIAAMAIQERAMSKDAPNPVQFVLNFYDMEQERPQDTRICCKLLDVLAQLPKESVNIKMLKPSRTEITAELQKAAPQLMMWLKNLLDQQTGTATDSIKNQILECFNGWLHLKMEPESLMPLVHSTFLAVRSPDTFEAAAGVLINLFCRDFIKQHPKTLLQLLDMVNELGDMIIAALSVQNMDAVNTLCCIMVTVGQSNSLELIRMLNRGGKDRKTALLLMENIMKVSFPPGQYLEDETISFMSISFWMSIQDMLVDVQNECRGGRDREGVEEEESLQEVMKHVFAALIDILITKVRYPDDQTFQHWGKEEVKDFEDYRHEIQDLLTCCFNILQENVLQYLHAALQSLLDRGKNQQPVQWQEVEAIYLVLGSMEKAGDLPDSHYMLDILRLLPSMQFPNHILLSTSLFVISTFGGLLGRHEDLLHELLPLVGEGLHHKESAHKAVQALHSLLKESLHAVLPYLPYVMATAQEKLMSNASGQKEDLKLMECVGVGLLEQSLHEAQSYLNTLLSPHVALIQQLTTQQPTEEATKLVHEVQLLSSLFSGLYWKEQGVLRLMRTIDGSQRQQTQLVLDLLQSIFPTLRDLVINWKSNADLVDAVSELFMQLMVAMGTKFRPMVESVIEMMMEAYQASLSVTSLMLLKEIVEWFSSDPTCTECLRVLLNILCTRTLQDFERIRQYPETLHTFNNFMVSMLRICRDLLLSSVANMEDLLKAGVETMKFQLGYVAQAGCHLTIAFLSRSTEDERLRSCVQKSMPLILGTVMEVLCNGPMADIVMCMTDVLQACCKHQLRFFSDTLRHYMQQCHLCMPLNDEERTKFSQILLRNYRNKTKCQELLMEFVLKCQTSHAGCMLYLHRDL